MPPAWRSLDTGSALEVSGRWWPVAHFPRDRLSLVLPQPPPAAEPRGTPCPCSQLPSPPCAQHRASAAPQTLGRPAEADGGEGHPGQCTPMTGRGVQDGSRPKHSLDQVTSETALPGSARKPPAVRGGAEPRREPPGKAQLTPTVTATATCHPLPGWLGQLGPGSSPASVHHSAGTPGTCVHVGVLLPSRGAWAAPDSEGQAEGSRLLTTWLVSSKTPGPVNPLWKIA